MLRILLIKFLLFLPVLLSAQKLQGIVYREGTESVISGASVYYNGSLTATSTNEKGEFSLPSKGQIPVTISCIGYYSASVIDSLSGQILKVYLKPKAEQLREVVVGSDGMSREQKERLFLKQFLGTSPYALSCNISNIEEVALNYSRKNQVLTASCNNPIRIENKKLGYHLTYYLDRFSTRPGDTFFAGNFTFTEIAELSQQRNVKRNREIVYKGSRMQFIRALWSDKLKDAGFSIFTTNYKALPVQSILATNALNEKFIHLKQRVTITHSSNRSRDTHLTQTSPYSFIDKNGFYDYTLRWSGSMTAERIGDMLPYEYHPGE